MVNSRILYFLLLTLPLAAQQVIISGKVTNESTNEIVEFGTVIIPEAKFKGRINPDGTYSVAVPGPGEYTLNLMSPGLKNFSEKILIGKKNFVKDIRMSLPITRTQTVKIRSERDIQKLGRNTLSVEQLKETPATFGDAINALATLPGVVRPGGFFGPLVIRGASSTANRYFIDDIPVPNPQHFGGLQSIVSNDIMKEVDLYSSAFPAQFGGALGAVIDIQTVDEVKEFGGVIDVSLISSNFLFRNKWGKTAGGDTTITPAPLGVEGLAKPLDNPKDAKLAPLAENLPVTPIVAPTGPTGYWIASGRVGYLSLAVPPIYKLITGKTIGQLPQYYDYQLKGKIALDSLGRHNLTGLVFGSYDTLVFAQNPTDEEKKKRREEGQDPATDAFSINNDVSSHSQGLYYDYIPSNKLTNRFIVFNSYTYSYFSAELGTQSSIRPTNLTLYPNILGVKDKVKFEWADFATLRLAAEYNLFYFQSNGQTQQFTANQPSTGQPDLGNGSLFQTVAVNFNDRNHLASLYAENKFQFGGLKFVPGVRSDYLSRTNNATVDPRGLIGYEFPTQTTISAAGGLYQSYAQTNSFLFNRLFNYQPQIIVSDYLQPERALHRTVGIEQKYEPFTFKIEGFYNTFDRLVQNEVAATNGGRGFSNNGQQMARGVEFFIRKDKEDKENEFYGWVSYTYTEAERLRNGRWGRFEFEQPHSVKLVAGFKFGANNIGVLFQVFSGNPYTQIISAACTQGGAYNCSVPETTRYSPEYSSDQFGSRFPTSHRLDIRYTRKTAYKWGYFSWYIEVINVYNYQAPNQQKWNYNKPYGSDNPTIGIADGALTIIPYFGLEWRF